MLHIRPGVLERKVRSEAYRVVTAYDARTASVGTEGRILLHAIAAGGTLARCTATAGVLLRIAADSKEPVQGFVVANIPLCIKSC